MVRKLGPQLLSLLINPCRNKNECNFYSYGMSFYKSKIYIFLVDLSNKKTSPDFLDVINLICSANADKNVTYFFKNNGSPENINFLCSKLRFPKSSRTSCHNVNRQKKALCSSLRLNDQMHLQSRQFYKSAYFRFDIRFVIQKI